MATIRELSLGLTGRICLDRQSWLKRHFAAKGSYNEVDKLFWQLRNSIFEMGEFYYEIGHCSQLKFQRKHALETLIKEKKKHSRYQ